MLQAAPHLILPTVMQKSAAVPFPGAMVGKNPKGTFKSKARERNSVENGCRDKVSIASLEELGFLREPHHFTDGNSEGPWSEGDPPLFKTQNQKSFGYHFSPLYLARVTGPSNCEVT